MSGELSLKEWMSDAEYEWRMKLKAVNLVIETDFTADQIHEAQGKWGAAARALLVRAFEPYEIVKKYPALTLTILVGQAALSYEEGRYWDSFWAEVGLARDADFERVLRHSITELLTKFSLARFPDVEEQSARKYVMLLALHAGIPVHCLGDLLATINDHIVQGRPANGAALLAWLDEPGKSYRANQLDVPVRNFFMYGAEFAVDILDRIIEFVEATSVDPQLLEADLDSSNTGLPEVILDELIQQLRVNPMRWNTRNRSGATGSKRPVIAYDVDDDEIFVALPSPTIGSDEPWRVSLDGDVRDVHCVRQWGASTDVSITRAAISLPVREVVLSHGPSEVEAMLAIVSKADPLLTFSPEGQWIPRRDGLKDAVWVVYPEDNEIFDPSTREAIALQNQGSPAGWQGWRSAFVELDSVGAVQLRWRGERVGTERQVRKDARPRFELGEPVVGVRSADGRAVHASRPWVFLPPSRLNAPQQWRVRTRRLGATEWITDESWDADEVETCVDPFDDAEDPQLGLFEIFVTGPLGADARVVVFLAEGLWVEVDRAIRLPESDGLTACTVEIDADLLTVTPCGSVSFAANQLEKPIDVAFGGAFERLVVRPSYVEVRSGEVSSPASWRVTAAMCAPDDLALDRFVAVRAPGVELGDFAFVGASGDRVQVGTRSRRKPGDVFEVGTQQFADTARMLGSGRIVATLNTEHGAFDVTALVICPKQLGSGVKLREAVLDFGDVKDVEGLAAYVWTATAPWRPPDIFRLTDGRIELPETLVDAGELRCQLFIDDPWVVLEPPRQPPEHAFQVDQLGWFEAGTVAQVRISRFLAGVGRLPDTVGAIPEAWAALAQVHADGRPERAEWLVPILVEEPRGSLDSLGNSSIALKDKMAMLMRSELVNHSYATSFTLNDLHADPWFGCMTEMSDLPSLYERRNDVRAERAETIGYLSDKGGEPLLELLRTGNVTAVGEGCFDEVIFAMESAPTGEVEAAVRERALVPRPLLHYDTRRLASHAAFLQRQAWLDTGWSRNFAAQVELVLKPIKRASERAYEAIRLRSERLEGIDLEAHPWMLMSVQSLTLAFLARLEACGRMKGQYLDKGLLAVWTRLAELCPSMVATDLLMAEALTLYDRKGDLIGEGQ